MTYDPIDNFLALKSIKTFIKNHGNNDNTEHEKLFDLFFFRTFSEIRMQSSQDVNKYIQKLSRQYDQETVMVKLYKKLYADETKLPSNPLNEVYTKAFVELTEEGFFNKNFKPIGVFSPKSYCLKTAYQNIKETYGVPNFMEQHFGKDLGPETDLSQYIKNTISDVFIRDSDETSRENMLSVLRDGETEILETYSIVGASHVGTFSPSKSQEYIHQAQSGQSKFKTLHITQKVDGRPVKQHLFPEKHGYPHSYNSLLKYIKNLQIPYTKSQLIYHIEQRVRESYPDNVMAKMKIILTTLDLINDEERQLHY